MAKKEIETKEEVEEVVEAPKEKIEVGYVN
jgi:hypothetical protein